MALPQVVPNFSKFENVSNANGIDKTLENESMNIANGLYIYFTPFLVVFGSIGNLVSIFVFFSSKLKYQSTSQYLSALALSDTIFLLQLIPPWLNAVRVTWVFTRDGFCQVFVYVSYVTCCLSAWLVVAFTIERFVAVLYPLRRSIICTVTRARYIILALATTAVLVNVPVLRFTVPTDNDCNIDYEFLTLAARFNMVDTAVSFTFPLAMIIVLNCSIMFGVYKLERTRHHLVKPPGRPRTAAAGRAPAGPSPQHRVTRMLLLVSTVFVLFNLPAYTMRVLAYAYDLFAAPRPSGESSCLQGPDCFMCWENCELLQSNYQVWGAVCEEKDICFPGCKIACEFHSEAARAAQTQPVIHTKGEGVMRVSGALARWPPPAPRAASRPTPLVYVVMRRAAEGPWRQIIQTQALATRVPSNNEGALLRVLVVDPQGLVTIYSPDETWVAHDINTSNHDEHKWTLKEISLIHQKVLVIGEIAWEPRIARGVYLVTWEVDGGGLKGNLFTDSTRVTLSLWPDTIYHIQVELVSRTPGVDNERSETMTIDTSRAQRVSTESVQDVQVSEGDRLMSVLVSSMRGERVPERAPDSELVLGCLSAMVAFGLAVLAAVVWRRRRRGTFPGTNVYVGSSSVLKRKLVEDFAPTAHCFQPVLAPGTPTNEAASRDVVV